MQLTSTAFPDGGTIPRIYTCQGDETSPPLAWKGVPQNAVSLVLIMEDPDVPLSLRKDGMFDHWVVFNMPPQTHALAAGASPPGLQGVNTGGSLGYYPPCPPDREHRYFFKLYALDSMLPLKSGATKHAVLEAMRGHILAQCSLMGRYVKT